MTARDAAPRARPSAQRGVTLANVDLSHRVFVVGPNAAGKSNFLDVFRFLHDIASVGGGLEAAVRKRQGVSKLRSLAARKSPDLVIRVDLASSDDTRWQHHLAITHDRGQRPKITSERVTLNGEQLVGRPNESDKDDPERLTQTYLQQVNVNKAFRPVAGAFASIRYLHIVPQLVREPERSVGRSNDPYGGDFLEQLATTNERTLRARLRSISNVLRVAVPQLSELELTRDARGVPHLRGRYEHWRPTGLGRRRTNSLTGRFVFLDYCGQFWRKEDHCA